MQDEDLLAPKTYRDTVSTVTQTGKRNWVYASKPVAGKFYNVRNIVAAFYLIIFFGMPFIKVNDMPFFMINILEGKFIIFSKIFWPQDFFIFAIAMITFIVSIVLFTVVFGRLFCGWACPQTIFMEFVFRKIEWLIEGSPSQQKKRNEAAWTTDKIIRKTSKHIIFFLLSFLIANTFLSYVLGIDELFKIIREPISEHINLLLGLIGFTFLFYAVYAYVREIVCTTICPYGRLQGVMFDKDTMQITYDYKRGEPRGKYKKEQERSLGDCIDCKKCVHVCPTGIDIRNGLQMECVSCSACIDECNDVMEHLGFKKGLIRYASENEISTGSKFHFNGRMKAYSVLLGVLIIVMVVLVASRKTIDASVAKVKGQLYQELPGKKIGNLFTAKIINKTNHEIPVSIQSVTAGGEIKLVGASSINLKKDALNEITFFVIYPMALVNKRSTPVKLALVANGQTIQEIKTKFSGPFN